MSVECLTNSELETLIEKFNTKDPQDRAVFYALIELKTHRSIRSLEGKELLRERKEAKQQGENI